MTIGNGDTTPTEHLHDGRREDCPSEGTPSPNGLHSEVAEAVGYGRRISNVETALLQLRADLEIRDGAYGSTLQGLRDDARAQKQHLASIDESLGKIAVDLGSIARSSTEVRGKLVTLSEIDAGHDAAIRETREALHGLRWLGAFAKRHTRTAGVVAFLIMTALQILTLLRAAPSAPTLPPPAPSATAPGVSR